MRNRFWVFPLVALIWWVLPVSVAAQSLDEVIEQSQPGKDVVDRLPTSATTPSSATSKGAQKNGSPLISEPLEDFSNDFPIGFPSLERLIDFLNQFIQKLIGRIKEERTRQEPVSADSGNQTGGASDDSVPGVPAVNEPPKVSGPGQIPAPSTGSVSGSEFLRRTENMTPADREREILKEILAGNIPDFLKTMKDVSIKMKLSDGKEHIAVYRVMPDYLCIGSNDDFVRIPMSPIAAQKIAEAFGCLLPTTKMVDDIYKQAQIKLLPQPMSSGKYPNWQARMTKNEFYREHQRLVEEQRLKSGHQLGDLIAGHKKDVVISNFLNSHKKNVIIYGWHDQRNGGKPIQGYGWGHEVTYADYSHGIRLINRTMTIDGQEVPVADVMKDKVLSRLLSNEGPVNDLRAIR